MNKNTSNRKVFIVEGNIGSGKSTLLKILKQQLPVTIIPEPTDKWQAVGSHGNLLDLFYKDISRWSYTFQSYAFITRIQALHEHYTNKTCHEVIILERSVYCDRFCFAKNTFESGFMTPLEWQLYQEWFTWLVEEHTPRPDGFIYLKTSPDISYKRLIKRQRSEESAVPLSYLQALHQKHEDWLVHGHDTLSSLKNVPVLALDGDHDFETTQTNQDNIMHAIKSFIFPNQSAFGNIITKPTSTQQTTQSQ